MARIESIQPNIGSTNHVQNTNPAESAGSDPSGRPIPITETTAYYRDRIIPKEELRDTGNVGSLGHSTSLHNFYHSNLAQLNPAKGPIQALHATITADQNALANQQQNASISMDKVERSY